MVKDMLFTGGAYLVVESGDKGKGKQNTDYFVSIVYDQFPTETISNNTQAKATSVNFETIGTAEVAKASDWVGYGDAIDFFSFELDAAGQIDLNLSNLTNSGLRIGSDLKVKLYDSTGKVLKLDKNLTSSELEIGTYAVSVEVSKPEKNWTGYDLSITKLA
ncbi:hypothetical protein SDC9_192561 [bioreactor metagenome]|uniref:Uncharacterized protein n=1 Tax=bioreactor metagenome TaxID=1076179 RepID=A0A645I9K6_9ZZZZ